MKSSRKTLMLLASFGLFFGVLVLSSGVASAAKPSPIPGAHFKNGEEPACNFSSTAVSCGGTIVGLGGQNVDILLDAPFTTTTTCRNPQNQNNPSQRTTTGTASGQTSVQNASNNLVFGVGASIPSSTAGTCRNNWIMTSSSSFTGTWTISVCVGGQLVLSQQSGAGAPAPSCS